MIRTDNDDDLGFHPGFPPNFDPKRAEKGLAQESRAFLPLELVAEGRSAIDTEDRAVREAKTFSEIMSEEDDADWQAEWLAGLTDEERYKYFGALCLCPHIRDWHGLDGNGHCRACKCERFHCRDCDTKGGHQATCEHYVLGEGTPVQEADATA